MTAESATTSHGSDHPDLQEYRAYLQRAETRLSTLHRVAGAFISGAGLLTLLPLLVSNTFSGLLALVVFYPSSGLPPPASIQRWLALAPVLASITLPLVALYLLIRDLILFYFTARTFRRDTRGRIYPRFILSGIMVSEPSLNSSIEELYAARDDPYVRDLLVPSPAWLRERILKEAQSIGDLEHYTMKDDEHLLVEELRKYILRQTASHVRSLPEEAAKMEASIARHQRFLRSLVLRYAKAFLLAIITTVATILAYGVLTLLRPVDTLRMAGVNPVYVWLITLAIYAAWAFGAAVVVRKPVAWLYADTSSSKSRRTPQSLLNFERSTLAVAFLSTAIVAVDVYLYAWTANMTSAAAWLTVAGTSLVMIITAVYCMRALGSEISMRRR